MSIFIVRHAETEQGAARVIQEPATPLSDAGRSQAEHLADRLARIGVGRILASDLARAVETAMIVSLRTGAQIELEPMLRERDFGELRGKAYSSLAVDPFGTDFVPPLGESWTAFHSRVAVAWERITQTAAEAEGNLLVVTHGLVCRALAKCHWNLPPGESLPQVWANASLTEVEAKPPWQVYRMNCVAHLIDTQRALDHTQI